MFVWNDDRPLLQKAEADELDLRTQFENKQQRAANLDAYKQQLAEMERSFGAMLRQLPGKTEVPNLLVDISQTGLAAGLRKSCSSPGREKSNGFYAELPIKIRLVGTYHHFGAFVSGIAALPRIVTLHDIQISAGRRESGGYDNLTMDVTAKTYRYIEDEGGAQARRQEKDRRRDVTIRIGDQPSSADSGARIVRACARRLRDRGLLGRPVRSAEVDRGDQEKAGRAHPAAARSEALRDLRVQRGNLRSPFQPQGPNLGQRSRRASERAPQPRVPRRLLARHSEDGGHVQGRATIFTDSCNPRTAWCTRFSPAITSGRTTAR